MRRLLLLVGAIVFVDTMFFAALTPLLPRYAEHFHLSKLGAGVLSAAYPAGALVSGIPSGLAVARLGVKPAATVSLLLMTVTTIVFGFAGSIALLDFARFLQGVASACAWTAGFTWLIGAGPRERRGELIGTTMATAIVGALFGPVLGGIASLAGTRATFTAIGVVALALAVWALATDSPAPQRVQPLAALVASLRDRRIQAGVWFVALPALLFGTLSVLAPLRLSELGFGAVAIGAVFLVAAACEATVAPLVGRLSDRRGRRLPLTIGLAGSAVATALLPWPTWGALLATVIVLAEISFGTFWTPAISLLSETAERIGLDHAFAFALVNLAWAPGQVLGSAVGGGLARATTDAVPYLLLCGACAISLLGLRGARRAPAAR